MLIRKDLYLKMDKSRIKMLSNMETRKSFKTFSELKLKFTPKLGNAGSYGSQDPLLR